MEQKWKTIPGLPAEVVEAVTALVDELTSLLGEALRSVVLYGDLARGEFHPVSPGIDVLLVIEPLSREQLEAIARPLRRRAARMARPARVRMRRRKPCVLARRRLFGWKVRLLTVVSLSGAGSGKDPWVYGHIGRPRPAVHGHRAAVEVTGRRKRPMQQACQRYASGLVRVKPTANPRRPHPTP